MATYNKFQDFVEQLGKAVHDLDGTHTLKVALTNTAPTAANTGRNDTDHPPPANTDGYTAGGSATTPTWSETGGVAKLVCTDVVFTSTGSLGPFRYAILYNDSATSPQDAVIGWWDYGSSVTLANTETFTVDFDPTNGVLTLQ